MKRPVTTIFGPPGTGKTTRLIKIVGEAMRRGYAPEEIIFVSFSRKAIRVARERAMAEFGYPKERFPWFRTLHSMAYKLLNLTPKDVMQGENYRELGAYGGYGFDTAINSNSERMPILDWRKDGDRCLNIYSLAKARMTCVEEEWRRSNYSNLPLERAHHFEAVLNQYRNANAMVDFTEMLNMWDKPHPTGKILIIDEGQDLTPQQMSFARILGKHCNEVWIAGDDDQAIYGFSGATAAPLLSFNGEREFLRQSYRVPSSIYKMAYDVIKGVSNRVEKDYAPRAEKGNIEHLADKHQVDLSTGNWLLLSRCRYGIDEWVAVAKQQNVVYSVGGEWSNRVPVVRAVVAWESLRKAGKISPWDKHHLMRYQRPEATLEQDWMSALLMSDADREYIRGLRRRSEPLTTPGRIVINTIHEAKGDEATNVAMLLDTNRRISANFLDPERADEERRVIYVGLTRAISNLYLIRPQRQNFYNLM